MKKIFMALMALATAAISFTSCSDNDYFFTAGEDDFPRILNTDIPEMSKGEPSPLPSIYRDANFYFEVIVSPADYTTVEWFIDGEKAHEGKIIDMPLMAGDYDVKIVATTTKGKQTYRNCTLTVHPLEGDPTLADDEQSRWLQVGKQVKIAGQNLEGVTAAYLNGEALAGFQNNGNSVSFTVPEMEDGNYSIVFETAEMKYGMGKFTVSHDKYVDLGTSEIVLFEGEGAVHDWGQLFVLPEYDWSTVPAGTIMHIDATMIQHDENYATFHLLTPSWEAIQNDIAWGEMYAAGVADGSVQTMDLELTQEILDKAIAGGGMAFQGYGFVVKKIYFELPGGNADGPVVLFEGEGLVHDWGQLFVLPEYDWSSVKAGSIMHVYATMIEHGEGYATFHMMTPSWGAIQNDFAWGDMYAAGVADGSVQQMDIELTQDILDKAVAGGGIAFQGLGFKVVKIVIE